MKALLIADSDEIVHTISRYIKPWGFDSIRYRSPIKAIENIGEIAPDAIFISTADFPRHWKTVAQFIRADTEKDTTVIVLLTGERFTPDDADKAVCIGVQAIISDSLTGKNDELQLKEIFARYKPAGRDSNSFMYEGIGEHAVFMFTNPVTEAIVTGKVEGISLNEIRFRPDALSSTADLGAGERLDQCSLKLDGKILSPVCRIQKNSNVMILDFYRLDAGGQKILSNFISGSAPEK